MPDKKLTDNEIVKALEECIELRFDDDTEYATVRLDILINALDLINHLQAKLDEAEDTIQFADKELKKANTEIERLEKDSKRLKKVEMQLDDAMKMYDTIKSEAYKECIEKVEEIICNNTYPDFDINHKAVNIWKAEAYKDIDNLLKELVGEDNASFDKN